MPGQWQASPKDHPCQSSPSDRPRTGIAKGSQHAILLSLDKEQRDFNVPINTPLDSHHPPTSRSKNQNKKKKREREEDFKLTESHRWKDGEGGSQVRGTKVNMILYNIEEEGIMGRASTVTLNDRNLTLKSRSSICSIFNYSFCTKW